MKFFSLAKKILTSWWFIGLIGWLLVIDKYPFGKVLPRYAG